LSQAIQVRNVDSGKVIVGAVQADGSVRIASQ
jgi:flagella basal body P-ring formation protein FlgA